MLKKPFLMMFFLLFAGAILFVFGMALHRAFEPIPAKKPLAPQPVISDRFNKVAMKLPGREGCYWDLRVEKTDNRSGIGMLQNVKGRYYRGSQMLGQVSSRSGRVSWVQGMMTLTGDVEFVTKDGKRITAETVTWDPITENITASGHVRFDEPGVVLKTEQLMTDINFHKVTSKGNTYSKLAVANKPLQR